jgi:hypothetical protein
LDTAFNKVCAGIATSIASNALSLSFTYDIWLSPAKQSYLGVTAHYITAEAKLISDCVRVKRVEGSHTGDVIAAILRLVIEGYGKQVMSQTIDILFIK